MPILPDLDFSVYQRLELSDQHKVLVRHKASMRAISHAIETAAAESGHMRLFSGFQRLSLFLPQVERYRVLARRGEAIYVFGIPDVEAPAIDNVHYIHLTEAHRLEREWFVVAYSDDYFSALSAQEMSLAQDGARSGLFRGAWTFNPQTVAHVGDWLNRLVGAASVTWAANDTLQQRNARAMADSLDRMVAQSDQRDPNRANEHAQTLRRELIETLRTELGPVAGSS